MSDQEKERTIVVGVDGSEDSQRALAWAIDEAKTRGMTLLLVHGIDIGLSAADPYGGGYVLEQLQDAGRLALDAAEVTANEQGVATERRMEIGSPAYALVDASRGAAMLVVGSRGHGGFAGLLLGSVSSACVHHAHCPIVVVPRPERATS